MYCLANICYVCLEKKTKLISNINSSLSANKDIVHIIGYLHFNLSWLKTKRTILICEECCSRLRETYQFRAMCLKNSALLQSYMDHLTAASTSNTVDEAELCVTLDLNVTQNDIHEVKCEIKVEPEECEPSIDGTEDMYVNFELIKEEDTLKLDETVVKEEHSMDNYSPASIANDAISVNTNAHITNTDSVSSGFTCKQVHATDKEELDAATDLSYTCSTCSKRFITESELIKHTRIHERENRYKCSSCDKCFSFQSMLTAHMRVHTGEKPYQCSTCNKCFSRKWSLVSHKRIHTGSKPYVCSICNKCFRQTSVLLCHMRIHTGEKPFKCSRCKKRFRQYVTMARHLQFVHADEMSHE